MISGLNRSDLIKIIAEKNNNITEAQADDIVRVMIQQMIEVLSQNKRIEIRGFGSLSLHIREARMARNPKTGEMVQVKEKVVPHFKPGKALKDAVNSQFGA